MNTFKITLLGDEGVGKTTLVNRHLTGQFDKKYIATVGVDVHPLRFNTNYGPKCINIWDCAGQDKFRGLGDGYYIQSQGLIVMFDLTSKTTFKNIEKWITEYTRIADGPIVLCGTKYDISRDIDYSIITELVRRYNIKYYEISSKTDYNIEKPFIEILRNLENKPDLVAM